MDWILGHWFSLLAGGLVVRLWTVARDRRKAVDRMVDAIEVIKPKDEPEAWRKHLKHEITLLGFIHTRKRRGRDWRKWQDAPGRIIVRSVERMTKR